MTLNNAKRRFEYLGFEVDKDVPPYRYKMRAIGSLKWTRYTSLEGLLRIANDQSTVKLKENDRCF